MEHIKWKGIPDERIQKAYDAGYYIEAIQNLHGFLENQSRSLLMLVGCVHFDADQSKTWDLSDTFSFNDTLKALRILNQISDEEFNGFRKFNSMRNKIIHQYYKSPYDDECLGVPKQEFDIVFHETLKQLYLFTSKCEEIIE